MRQIDSFGHRNPATFVHGLFWHPRLPTSRDTKAGRTAGAPGVGIDDVFPQLTLVRSYIRRCHTPVDFGSRPANHELVLAVLR